MFPKDIEFFENRTVKAKRVHFMNNFKRSREDKKLTAQEVSLRLGITKTAVYSIEKGSINPNVKNLDKFADLYNVSIDYLLGRSMFKNFTEQYEYLQSLSEDEICKELDVLGVNEWTTKCGKTYSKLNGEWFITIRG